MVNELPKSQSLARRLPRVVIIIGSVFLTGLVFVAGMGLYFEYGYTGKLFPNTYVAGVQLGGLTPEQADDRLEIATDKFREQTVAVRIDDNDPDQIKGVDLGLTYDIEGMTQTAYDIGRSGNLLENFLNRSKATFVPINLPALYTYDAAALSVFIDELSKKFDEPEMDAQVKVAADGTFTIDQEKSGQRFDQQAIRSALDAAFRDLKIAGEIAVSRRVVQPSVAKKDLESEQEIISRILSDNLTLTSDGMDSITIQRAQIGQWITATRRTAAAPLVGSTSNSRVIDIGFSREKVLEYVGTIATKVSQEPVDARLTIVDGKASVFSASRDGRKLNEDEAATLIMAKLEERISINDSANPKTSTVKLPVETTKATVTSGTVDELGIRELIGTATTDFSGSSSSRVHNITAGTKHLNGWLLKPGEEFSTIKALGEVSAATGYLPELVIKENRTIPEYGGGLCQVSTTLFRSVLQAGLPVSERRNHSYRVAYYERGIGPGLDATVYIPKPDFRFKNDTPGWILVQGRVDGNTVNFELYGTKDGRVSIVDGPRTLSTIAAPEPIYEETDQIAPGEVKQIEKAHNGASTIATYTVKRGDQVLFSQEFTSKYKALPARYLKGKEVTESQPAPTEGEQAAPPSA